MALISIYDWIQQQDESSPWTRLRHDAALGLKPKPPAASVHSRSTGSPFEVCKLAKDRKGKSKNNKKK